MKTIPVTEIIYAVDDNMMHVKRSKGFSLFELILVLVILSSILILMTNYLTTRIDESRRDRAVLQIEQILNAGMAYYINYSEWPDNINTLQSTGYLPNKGPIINPWGREYGLNHDLTTGTFSVCSSVLGSTSVGGTVSRAVIESGIVAGRLPMAYSTDQTFAAGDSCPVPPIGSVPTPCDADECTVISTINIPGQNLNNARSINFAGLYHNGACVPRPSCPLNMSASIMVVPVSVSGNYYQTADVLPINSFTAFATPFADRNSVQNCFDPGTSPCTADASGALVLPGVYWRVCLQLITSEGNMQANKGMTKESGTVMAVTRCVPVDEPSGSGFDVFKSR